MGKQDEKRNSPLYYFTLSVVLSLLVAAAMSQGQERDGMTQAPQQVALSQGV